MKKMNRAHMVMSAVVLGLLGAALLTGGCGPGRGSTAIRLPDAPRLVGGGILIEWQAPEPGTAYLVEKRTGKIVETRSLDEGGVYSFAATSVVQADEFEQMLGIPFGKAQFLLYFQPTGEAGETAVARQVVQTGSRF